MVIRMLSALVVEFYWVATGSEGLGHIRCLTDTTEVDVENESVSKELCFKCWWHLGSTAVLSQSPFSLFPLVERQWVELDLRLWVTRLGTEEIFLVFPEDFVQILTWYWVPEPFGIVAHELGQCNLKGCVLSVVEWYALFRMSDMECGLTFCTAHGKWPTPTPVYFPGIL